MKLGFSLFLRKYIKPGNVEYGDCKTFQIICPECKEPVFKVSRKENVDYFSHYKKDKTLVEQCELRVNAISIQFEESANNESRKQSLKSFLEVLQDIIWENEYDDNTLMKSKKIFFRMNKCQTYSEFIIKLIHSMRQIASNKNEIFSMFDESIENIYREQEEFTTEFSINLQKNFAYDFYQHILAGHSKTNYFFLMIHAFILLYNRLKDIQDNEMKEWEKTLYAYMNQYLNTQNREKRMKVFYKLANQEIISPYTHDRIDLFSMFGSQLQYHAFAILLRIPYLKILQKNVNLPENYQSQ
ncbi:MAG: hypothetical protein GY754_45660 [bacterium]|nr:hypothetical protein [bacterium]